ncbi:TPA: hypothetical protein R4Y94_003469 [Enterobacter mori]|nr:hypothetical protein [Enterobacter mori]
MFSKWQGILSQSSILEG